MPPLPRWSGWQASLPRSSGAHELALATCATTMTNPGKVGHLPQTKPHTAKASDAAQTLRGIYENASGDDDRA
jgi:hypothetical protein